jgi:6-pyruvoyltetrahydropterin/6-carboxytetrahydropterin synthase
MLLRKTFRFEASHILPKHPGKCSRLHGHSWVLHVFVEGFVDKETGFVMDFAEISNGVKPLIDSLDHRHLGTIEFDVRPSWQVEGMPWDFYPSSENLLYWIGDQLKGMVWSKLALEETCTSYAELTREEFDATRNQS